MLALGSFTDERIREKPAQGQCRSFGTAENQNTFHVSADTLANSCLAGWPHDSHGTARGCA